jgi:hypothetical protein
MEIKKTVTGVWIIKGGSWADPLAVPTEDHDEVCVKIYEDFQNRLIHLSQAYTGVTKAPLLGLPLIFPKMKEDHQVMLDGRHLRRMYAIRDVSAPELIVPIYMYAFDATLPPTNNAGNFDFSLLRRGLFVRDINYQLDSRDWHPRAMSYNIKAGVLYYLTWMRGMR